MELEFHDFSLGGLFGRKNVTQKQDRILNTSKIDVLNIGKDLHPFRDMKYPIHNFTNEPEGFWTLEDAVRGTQIFGGIGSGKSSGSGRALALAFLRNGFGGLVLCGKPDELKVWREYADETGRLDDIIVFSKDSGHFFNPFVYELTRSGEGAGETSNLVNLFMNIYQLGQRINGSDVKETQRFWENALRRCLGRTIDLLKVSGQELSVKNMVEVISSAPHGEDYLKYIHSLSREDVVKWFDGSYCTRCLFEANLKEPLEEERKEEHGLLCELLMNYFLRDFAMLAHETRSGVVESFLGLAEPFLSGVLSKQFSKNVTIFPEETHKGKIIILNFPVKEFLEVGIYAQSIFKLMWQQATERREAKRGDIVVPVFLWVDESQFFVTDYDMLFQTTARSCRACTVFLTQNISNYYAVLGGNNSKAKVDSLLGNLSTRIFHANNDFETNQWAANSIGKEFRSVENFNVGLPTQTGMPYIGGGSSNQLHFQIEPREFTTLKSGGENNDFIIEAYIQTTSKRWAKGKNHSHITFEQEQKH